MIRINLFLALLFFGLLVACENPKEGVSDEEGQSAKQDTVEVVESDVNTESNGGRVNDYLNICKEPFTWIGGIQGLKPSDSTKVYPMGECTSGKQTYRLIWLPNAPFKERKKWSAEEVTTLFEDMQNRNKNFTCYKFIMPLHDRDEVGPDGETVIFPCEAEVFKQTNSGWKSLGIYGLESNAQFARVQLNALFGYLDEKSEG